MDRRQKIYATMLAPKDHKRREAHGRWVCHTWRSPAGQAPHAVDILRIEETIPPPTWPVTHGALDPHTVTDMDRREVALTTVHCDDS